MKYDKNLTVFDFYRDGFSVVIDLRGHEDNEYTDWCSFKVDKEWIDH